MCTLVYLWRRLFQIRGRPNARWRKFSLLAIFFTVRQPAPRHSPRGHACPREDTGEHACTPGGLRRPRNIAQTVITLILAAGALQVRPGVWASEWAIWARRGLADLAQGASENAEKWDTKTLMGNPNVRSFTVVVVNIKYPATTIPEQC